MRADRTIGILDGDRDFQDGLKGLPDVKALGFTANKDGYRLEVARQLARRLGRDDARAVSVALAASRAAATASSFGCSSALAEVN